MILKTFLPVVLATGAAAGGFLHPFQGQASCSPLARFESRLQLSPEQKKALHRVFEQHRPALGARVETLVQARNAALEAGLDPAVSPAAWRPTQDQFAQAARGLAQEIRAAYLDALPVLDEAQKAEGRILFQAIHGKPHRFHGYERIHDLARGFVKHRLNLTDEQDRAIQAIVERHQPALKARAEALHEAHARALQTALDPAASQALLDQSFAAVQEAALALSHEVRATYLEAQVQLSPEQRGRFRNLVRDAGSALDAVRKLALGF